jgi:hypothetical protein
MASGSLQAELPVVSTSVAKAAWCGAPQEQEALWVKGGDAWRHLGKAEMPP